jgi:hypothetical protein
MHNSNGTTSQTRPPFFCPKLVADSGRWITKKRESQQQLLAVFHSRKCVWG